MFYQYLGGLMKSLLYKLFFTISCAVISINSFADDHKKTMWELITNDSRFATFAVMVEKAGLENLFNGKVNVNATVYIPTNEAFETMPESIVSAFRVAEFRGPLIKLIQSHYFVGTNNNLKEGEYLITTNINGDKVRIEQNKQLFVKDMVIQDDPIKVGKNKIIPVECVMFVQPSITDNRLTLEQQEQFRITSCCLRTVKEAVAFLKSNKFVAP